jgi:hypothetical protein
MAGSCGDCGLCCNLMEVTSLNKPRRQWCSHFKRGVGCGIYEDRPVDCRAFQCAFLTVDGLSDDWRPDRAGFLIWTDGVQKRLIVDVDPARPFSWKREPYYSQIKAWSAPSNDGATMVAVRGMGRVTVVFPMADIDIGPERESGQISAGYRLENGVRRPFAEYVDAPAAPAA